MGTTAPLESSEHATNNQGTVSNGQIENTPYSYELNLNIEFTYASSSSRENQNSFSMTSCSNPTENAVTHNVRNDNSNSKSLSNNGSNNNLLAFEVVALVETAVSFDNSAPSSDSSHS